MAKKDKYVDPLDVPEVRDHLNYRQIMFCREYVVDWNGTAAAIRAGYNKPGAKTLACLLLKEDKIKKCIDRLTRDRCERLQIDADMVLANLSRLANADIRELYTHDGAIRRIEELSDEAAAGLVSTKVTKRLSGEVDEEDRPIYDDVVEFRMADKIRANEMLAKHLKLLSDKVEVQHSGVIGLEEVLEEIDGADTGLPTD